MPRPAARRATSWPIRPKPRIASVFSASSTPPHLDRSHRPCLSAACACGMLRASATSSPIVCSAAETMFDSGAFATTMPCRVAAATSTLSTPTPARPITFSRPPRSIRSAVSFVADRITIASYSPIVSARSESPSTTTSNFRRRSSTPASAIVSRTRTLKPAPEPAEPAPRSSAAPSSVRSSRRNGLRVRLERPRHRDAALDRRPELVEPELDRGERGRDVEHVVPADVPDPEDLALQACLPRRERDAPLRREQLQQLVRVDAVGRAHGGDDRGALLV